MFFRSSATFGRAVKGPRDGLVWHREGRKMAIGQCRSAISFDDVAQKTTLARSAHQDKTEWTSRLLEERCDEFVPLVSVRLQGLEKVAKQSTSSSEIHFRKLRIDDVVQKRRWSNMAQHVAKLGPRWRHMAPRPRTLDCQILAIKLFGGNLCPISLLFGRLGVHRIPMLDLHIHT